MPSYPIGVESLLFDVLNRQNFCVSSLHHCFSSKMMEPFQGSSSVCAVTQGALAFARDPGLRDETPFGVGQLVSPIPLLLAPALRGEAG